MLSFACILVEVDLSKELPSLIWIDLEEAEPIAISVEFENLPCSTCLLTGHKASICPQIIGKKVATHSVISPLESPLAKPDDAGILGHEPSVNLQEPNPASDLGFPKIPPISYSTATHSQLNPFDLLDLCSMKDYFIQATPTNSHLKKMAPVKESENLANLTVSLSPSSFDKVIRPFSPPITVATSLPPVAATHPSRPPNSLTDDIITINLPILDPSNADTSMDQRTPPHANPIKPGLIDLSNPKKN